MNWLQELTEAICERAQQGQEGPEGPRHAIASRGRLRVIVMVLPDHQDLSRRELLICESLAEQGLNLEGLRQALLGKGEEVSERTIRRDLKPLQKAGVVEQRGKGRKSKYVLTATIIGERQGYLFPEEVFPD